MTWTGLLAKAQVGHPLSELGMVLMVIGRWAVEMAVAMMRSSVEEGWREVQVRPELVLEMVAVDGMTVEGKGMQVMATWLEVQGWPIARGPLLHHLNRVRAAAPRALRRACCCFTHPLGLHAPSPFWMRAGPTRARHAHYVGYERWCPSCNRKSTCLFLVVSDLETVSGLL